ncbi:hypothetical protein VTN31DRAFT_4072 [Thermomyces dupontii]|uniref:uncharacterized protein n=1 Tax=Talaromyces thermophilus TaxID=28565 RepID=UPI003742F0B2
MLDSLHRVLDTTDEAWIIRHEPLAKRAQEGLEEFSRGHITGMAKALKGLANEDLGLPEECLDEATKRAVIMVESGWKPHARA